jgi:diguanylate cyclase (GGDEF)-like protein
LRKQRAGPLRSDVVVTVQRLPIDSSFGRFFPIHPWMSRYAGVDPDIARRMGGVIWLIGAILALAVLPLAPPTAEIGSAGWIVAGGQVVVAFGGAALALRRPRVPFNTLLAGAYLTVGQIAFAQWLSGGLDAPYWQLYMLPTLHVAAIHPPRRIVPFMVALMAAAFAPLVYVGWQATAAAAFALGGLLWIGTAVITYRLMSEVRTQRIKSQREEDHARRLARIDALTGLGNRRAFDEAIVEQIAEARASDQSLSVLLADLDGFKQINDEYGHVNGDSCLRQVARTLQVSIRATDAAFRWGGDEFAVLLPGADSEQADELCARVKTAVRSSCQAPDGAPLVVSCGHTELCADMDAEGLVEAADLALLTLKRERSAAA